MYTNKILMEMPSSKINRLTGTQKRSRRVEYNYNENKLDHREQLDQTHFNTTGGTRREIPYTDRVRTRKRHRWNPGSHTEPYRIPRRQSQHRRGVRSRPRDDVRSSHCSFKETALEEKDPSEAALTLGADKVKLNQMLNKCKNNAKGTFSILKVLARCFQSNSTPEILANIISIIKEKEFIMSALELVLSELTTRTKDTTCCDIAFVNILTILLRIFEMKPSEIVFLTGIYKRITKRVPALVSCSDDDVITKSSIEVENTSKANNECLVYENKRNSAFLDNLEFSEVQRLFSEFEFCIKTSLERNKKCETIDETNFEKDVLTDNFRNISVYPTNADLMRKDDSQLRHNRINGKYVNATEYLDIHFRLMREDFIAPLRNGICQASTSISNKKGKKFQDVKIYEHVRIISAICEKGINHVLHFDTSKLQHINWHTSKRLKYGSLLVLSADNFSTCFFATITNSDVKIKQSGRIYVRFNNSIEKIKSLVRSVFTMAESCAFFESHRAVLTALQRIRETKFPFERYILFCEKEVLPPKYLRKNTDCQFDLLPLCNNTMTIGAVSFLKEPGRLTIPFKLYDADGASDTLQSVKLLGQIWPSAEDLLMDESQLRAIKTALTKEFSIIQGPPGCGKTYIGLAIVKALLHNKTAWQNDSGRRAQLMVVCYTNHALDQFMEGICSFYDGDIVRIGSRSSSEVLKIHNLKEIKKRIRNSQQVKACIHRGRRFIFHEMEDRKMHINENAMFIEVIKENIVKEEYIRREIGPFFYKQFEWYRLRMRNLPTWLSYLGESVLVRWLGIVEMAKNIQNDNFNAYRQNEVLQNQDEQQKYDEDDWCDRKKTVSQEKEIESFKSRTIALDISKLNDISKTIRPSKIRDIKTERAFLALKIRNRLASTDYLSDNELEAVDDIFSPEFTTDKRWRLYLKWVHDKCSTLEAGIAFAMKYYNSANNIRIEINNQEEKNILQNADVIGLTTTCAANRQALLQEIKPKIIIVEEAAEIFESHVISCISSECEQLIMIGDHQQLRPKPNVYKMETEYNLHISLFERMIRNGLHYDCLQIQHRMRPEISCNIKNMYPYLQDHSNVLQYEKIKGIRHSLFFISHKYQESKNDEISSYTNLHEANFILALCQYLILQGYKSTDITVLTTYKGQMYAIQKNIRERYPCLGDVHVTVVDNYQGEENEIILLSLVRSNLDNVIGYVARENRICVALSRARKGLYVIGNFDAFSKTELWGKIVSQMKQKGFLGENLLLKCQNHIEDEGILVQTAKDFKQVSEGGCGKQCDARLKCGHVCPKKCHTFDKEHQNIICKKPCTKQCVRGHKCQEMCHQQCNCSKEITQKLEKCEHEVKIQCSQLTAYFKCNAPCGKWLSCGHFCQKKCHESCEPCTESVYFKRPDCEHLEIRICSKVADISRCTETCGLKLDCGHSCLSVCGDLQCQIESKKDQFKPYTKSQSLCPRGHSVLCNVSCEASLLCGHTCTGTCSACFQGRWHIDCQTNCQCILVCEHTCTGTCNNCKPCIESCRRQCMHRPCLRKCSEVCCSCKEICGWKCTHFSCNLLCGEPCNRPRCNEPCQKKLTCTHDCIGLCGDPCPILCRICSKRDLAKLNANSDSRYVQLQDCGHIVEFEAMDKYMDIDEGARLKVCPVCHVPIYFTNGNRYEGVVNRIIRKMNNIKLNVLQNKDMENCLSNQSPEILILKLGTFSDIHHNIYDRINWYIKQINAYSILLKLRSLQKKHEYSGCWRSIHTVLPPPDRCKITPQRAMETEREMLRYFDSCMVQEILDMLKLTHVTDENILKNASMLKELLTNKGSYDDKKRRQVKEQLTNIYKGDISSFFVNIRIQFREENFKAKTDGLVVTTDGIVASHTDGIVAKTDGTVASTDGIDDIVATTNGIVATSDGIVTSTDGIVTSTDDIVAKTDVITATTDGIVASHTDDIMAKTDGTVASTDGIDDIVATTNGIVATSDGIVTSIDGIVTATDGIASTTDGIVATNVGIAAATDGIAATINDFSIITLMVWSGAGYFKCKAERKHIASQKRKHEEDCNSVAPFSKIRKLEQTRVDSQKTKECSHVDVGSRSRIYCTQVALDSRKPTDYIGGADNGRGSKRQFKRASYVEKSKTPTVVHGNALTLQRPAISTCKEITTMDGTGKNANGTRKCHDRGQQNSRDNNYNKLKSPDKSNGSESMFDTNANIDIVTSITAAVPNKSISYKEQITVTKQSPFVSTRDCQLKRDDLRNFIKQTRANQSQQVGNNNLNTTDLLETFGNPTDVTRTLRKRRSNKQNDSKAGDLRKVIMKKRLKNENDNNSIEQKNKLCEINTKFETVEEIQPAASKSINVSSKSPESVFTTDGNINPHAHHIRNNVEPPGGVVEHSKSS